MLCYYKSLKCLSNSSVSVTNINPTSLSVGRQTRLDNTRDASVLLYPASHVASVRVCSLSLRLAGRRAEGLNVSTARQLQEAPAGTV